MAGEWTPIALANVLSFSNGRASPDRADGLPYPVYGSNGIIGFADEANADSDTIVIGRVGSYCGSLYFSKQKCWVTDNAIRGSALSDNDTRYLFYLLQTLDLNHWRAGSGQPLLNQTILGTIPASLPAPKEQRAIAHILGTLDDKIELNNRMNEALEAIARAIFKSWFVDFDPVCAKAEGRDPGLPKDIADLFPDSFQDSDLGQIPKGWDLMPVGNALTPVGGGTPSTKEPAYWEGGEYHFATPKDLSSLSAPILLDTERRITEDGLSQISSGLLPAGTVLMSSRAPVGYLAIAAVPVAVNQGFIAMTCDRRVSNYYALNWCHFNMDEIKQRASGTTFAEISKAAFRPIPMIVPAVETMNRFSNLLHPLYSSIEHNLRQSRTFATIRDTLLPKLISGELRVPDAERLLSERA